MSIIILLIVSISVVFYLIKLTKKFTLKKVAFKHEEEKIAFSQLVTTFLNIIFSFIFLCLVYFLSSSGDFVSMMNVGAFVLGIIWVGFVIIFTLKSVSCVYSYLFWWFSLGKKKGIKISTVIVTLSILFLTILSYFSLAVATLLFRIFL